ncbi:BadF/BadG/BcrA/BcrD ATPase family protein [Parvicella tangerina]|uniref:ATPase BadF/BadG/BcrA/BcrD type domain-containing protein n=1 Tax=Parvicella tangerina TaxID=2829795 RepID=A0A916JIV4_9FLAO|nr:BadF/BadG/BcrA/BcrD ATPase family protein [Parvicella tangerina]CAG5076284.1 hypothetical protein CRYO30217_00039 [Parvicella tangerina]
MFKLIADSGSTKTDWVLTENGVVIKKVRTVGLNPYLNTKGAITTAIRTELLPSLSSAKIKGTREVEFYGAGCSNDEKKNVIASCIRSFFPLADVVVEHDLLGAAKAVCNNQPGIAAILGTGSNSCYFDGEKIVRNVISLGFILGDEGSGCYIGKQLIADFLNEEMPEELNEHLRNDMGLCKDQIFDNVYKKPRPNPYLASFTKWIDNYYDDFDYLHELIKRSFTDFFVKSILKYENHESIPINVVGSVGHRFRDELEEVAKRHSCNLGTVIKSPIDGLIK